VIRQVADLTVTPLVVVAIGTAAVIFYRALRRRRAPGLLVASVALTWLLVLAAMAQLDLSTGVERYLAPCTDLVCVLVGLGCVTLARLVARGPSWGGSWPGAGPAVAWRAGAGIALAAVVVTAVPSTADAGRDLGHDVAGVRNAQHNALVLASVVAAAGGPEAILRCGGVTTGPFEHPIVSWQLGAHLTRVTIFGIRSGTALEMPVDPVFGPKTRDRLPKALTVVTRIHQRPWVLASSCRLRPAAGG
jgi:hypothetical protein